MILYDYWRSSAAYRVRIALNLKGIAYESVAIDLVQGAQHAPEYVARNPQGLLPALDLGDTVLTQSLAIIAYLDATHPTPALLPHDPVARAQAMAQALVIAADIHPIDNLRVLNHLTTQFGADQAAREDWYRHWIVEGLSALETMTVALPGPFLGGEAPNIADICLVPQLYNARRFSVPLDAWPRLVAADTAAAEIPAFAAAHPDLVKPSAA
ncbi:maleylacetoacetate isomerase [Sphingomonas glacialis]|uniref:Maleylacetoacetate isomerase n=1 Tax=Sphingomonas glacialis TaxID=658225 RepID=A0A502FUZ6_9SPHN|nr:maleylacetoacetate isomerase [Sphingomonas glacialis]TPG52926.1 maleylacetoacetate isomerase [Sphingomonas glacialis]